MDIAGAAAYFDEVTCADAFTPATTFLGQLDLFDDSRRDGLTVLRRILSVAPSVSIPARRVLTIAGEQWIVGIHEDDSFRGSVVRQKYVVQRAHGACTIQTIAQLLSTGGTASYAGKIWIKDAKELEVDSNLNGFYNIYLPSTETVAAGDVISVSGRVHIVRNKLLSAAGFLVAESDELPAGCVVSSTYKVRTYAPSTDTWTLGSGLVSNALQMRFQSDYAYPSESAPKFEAGDTRLFVRKAVVAAAKVNDIVTLPDGTWAVRGVSDEGACHGLHLRRAPA